MTSARSPHRRIIEVVFATGLLAFSAMQPALAQSNGAAPAQAGQTVDETALRYFARQGDQQRLEAEIARLSAIYPGWVPPADPLGETSSVDPDLQRMWDLYGEGDYDAVVQAIAEKQDALPEWRPPLDLADALEAAQLRTELIRASEDGDDETVIEIAATRPDLLVCGNVDVLWRLAEAFIDSGREDRGFDAYVYILENCENEQERVATVQKAVAMMNSEQIADLFTFERGAEFEPARLDLARRAVSEVLDGIAREAEPDQIDALALYAEDNQSAPDMLLLGYYELSAERPRQALDWFESALEVEADVTTASAVAVSLMELGRYADAEVALADYRQEDEAAETLYLGIAQTLLAYDPPRAMDAETLDRIREMTLDTQSAPTAVNMGWYAYNFDQLRTASNWFEQALAFDSSSEEAAYGLLVASNGLRETSRVREIQRQWGEISPRIQLFGRPGAPTAAPMAFGPLSRDDAWLGSAVLNVRVRQSIQGMVWLTAEATPAQKAAGRMCSSYVPPESLAPGAALTRGWCLMELDRASEAVGAFQRAMQTTSTTTRTDAAYGLTLAYVRLDLVSEAAVAAASMPQTERRNAEMQIAILTSTAISYYDVGRFEEAIQALDMRSRLAPEQNDLMTIRAWSYYHLGFKRQSRQVFEALAAAGVPEARAGLEALGVTRF